jgi:hypothetical protein
MVSIAFGLAALVALWWLAKGFAHANPAVLVRLLRQVGGVAAFGTAAFLLFRGRIDMAVALGGVGAWLLGVRGFAVPGWAKRTQPTAGSVSRVRSALLEMALDHDSGNLTGQVLAGPFEGRDLDTLDEPELAALAELCVHSDPDGARLLQSYLDRRFPGRGEAAQSDADPSFRQGDRTQAMSEKEAYEILGLDAGAGAEDIRRAHRELMKKLHPDQGGSTYLATRVNQAKDVLLSRHR